MHSAAAADSPVRIEAAGIAAGYGRENVLSDITLTLRAGELTGLIGPNGAGKSTLLRVLSGVLVPRCGSVSASGSALSRLPARERARLIAFVPQTEPSLFEFSVLDVVLMGRHPYIGGLGGETDEDYSIVGRAMESAGIRDLAARSVTEISGGEHRRVLIARALAQCAPTLLLDEPTAHLDLAHQVDVMQIMRALADRDGACVCAALHDLNLAAEYCDRLILMAHGRIEMDSSPTEVLTAENLLRVYGAEAFICPNPESGKPHIFLRAGSGGELGP